MITNVEKMNNINSEIESLRVRGAVSNLGTHWQLVDYISASDMGQHWDVVDEDKSADDFGGNHTVYELLIGKDTYAGETGRTLKERFDSGHGYDNQPLVKAAIERVGWKNVVEHTIIEGLKDRKTAENYEKQVIKIRKANLCNNEGGRGNVKGAKYDTGRNIIATKNGKETIYRTITDASEGTGISLGTICNRCKDGLCTKGYKFRWIQV